MKRIVLTTFGSLGDLHPFLAVGVGLKERGYDVAIATSDVHREQVLVNGLEFREVRPKIAEFQGGEDVQRRLWNPLTGTEFLIQDVMLPHLEDSFEDLYAACAGADLVVTHPLWYAAPVVTELLKIPLAAVALQPATFVSSDDPSVIAAMPWLHRFRPLGPYAFRQIYRSVHGLASLRARAWAKPIAALRLRHGATALTYDPILRWATGANQTMGWFSPLLGAPQLDWPSGAVATGFPFYDSTKGLSAATAAFLDAGEPPIVFTLGSAAVRFAGSFYEESAEAARLLGLRAILLVGEAATGPLGTLASGSIHVTAYEPFSALFPRAAALVHQCGIGTTGKSLRAGIPVLGVPWGHDQFDNADRLSRLGCGEVLSRSRYTGRRTAAALERLLGSATIAARCAEVAKTISAENGVKSACDVLEAML
jgi:UDP:flavonoid glycosyltransferase YjiC (YdhE family)